MKENRKGHTRSYRHSRKTIAVSLVIISFLGWAIITLYNQWQHQPPNSTIGIISKTPLRQIEYGAQSTPLVMIQTKLDDQLLQRFLKEHLYSCQEDELNSYPGLDNRVKHPVYVYEGYYHSLLSSQTFYSKNPNPLIGTDFDKPPASDFTRAFFEAFRVVNKEVFDTLRQNLIDASAFDATGNEDVCYVLAQWIEKGRHFGDLSIQIHYGEGNESKLTSGVAWHQDAENSLLHLAVTLRGERVLHSKRMRRRDIGKNNNLRPLGKQHELQLEEVFETQKPGNVYLSSSTLMNHAPQFFDTDYKSRVIAIHARILYTSAEVNHFRKVRTKQSWDKLTSILADTLAAADLSVPTLAQVDTYLNLLTLQ